MLQVMGDTAFLNGAFVHRDEAKVSAWDRGFMFADAVYEVVRYYNGRALGMTAHLERLAHSLGEIDLVLPDDSPMLDAVSDALVERNGEPDAAVYWQVTRGAAERDHRFPPASTPPTVFVMSQPMPPLRVEGPPATMTAMTTPEIRWPRCGIKATALLPNVLARQEAAEAGCDEALFVRPDGSVAEGTARSVFMVADGRLRTHPLDGTILGSITRRLVLDFAAQLGIDVDETPFAVHELYDADELIAAGTTTEIKPIVSVDGKAIGHGEVGPVTRRLVDAYRMHVVETCGVTA